MRLHIGPHIIVFVSPTITLPNGKVYAAVVRSTAEERAEGMQYHVGLAPDEVMLFIHPNPRRVIYHMRNVVVSLDMVRLDEYGRVTWIETAPAKAKRAFEDYGAIPSSFMVEAMTGWAKANGLRVGDRVLIRVPNLR